jgi:hypothetical protein
MRSGTVHETLLIHQPFENPGARRRPDPFSKLAGKNKCLAQSNKSPKWG